MIIGLGSRFLFLINGYPELPNFTAIGAVALFGAYYLNKPKSLIIPLVILWLSDIVLNNVFYSEYFASFSFFGDKWVYLGFLATIVTGWFFLKKLNTKNVVISSFIGALLFFLITNFSVWLTSSLYPKDLNGLMTCYIKGIPFFRNAFLGNVFFSAVLFGSYAFFTNRKASLETSV